VRGASLNGWPGASVRRDYLHKTTTAISKNHAVVVVEDLQVRNMSKSAAGTAGQPGRNVKAKSGLNRSILDQGWSDSAASLNTSSHGEAGMFWPCRPKTPAGRVRPVGMWRRITGKHKRGLPVK
jgi:putative transposase